MSGHRKSKAEQGTGVADRHLDPGIVGGQQVAGNGQAHASAETQAAEQRAADRIFGLLPPGQAKVFRALWDEFEARKTAEAQFARAMDRLQPLLHNFFTSGGPWHTPGVNASDVLDRKAPISQASDTLWEAAQRIIAEGVERGYLKQG